MKLSGYLFFGTIHQLDTHILEIVNEEDTPKFRYLVLDFSGVSGIDYSAAEAFLKFKRILLGLKVHLLVCGLEGAGRETISNTGLFDSDEMVDVENLDNADRWIHTFASTDEALEWSENQLLQTYYAKLRVIEKAAGIRKYFLMVAIIAASSSTSSIPFSQVSPRKAQAQIAASHVLKQDVSTCITQPELTSNLIHILNEISSNQTEPRPNIGRPVSNLDFVAMSGYFERVLVGRGQIWVPGDPSLDLYIVESGELESSVKDRQRWHVVETMLSGTMVGELELFSNQPRVSRLHATKDSVLWKMRADQYEEMSRVRPELALAFIRLAMNFVSVRLYNQTAHHHAL